ncbi:AAA family ATPase [uncultured Sunxiuqinia sp.]|uniref:AAA family ATPase n=1 Tax=uncultured Sunxiuqinia sp. TaxID=1573825 RepID=UPI003748484C
MDEQLKTGGHKLPWKDRRGFQQAVFARRLDFYQSVKSRELAFSDLGLPDQLAFARCRKANLAEMLDVLQNYRYFSHMFITSPWNKIYGTDAIRK